MAEETGSVSESNASSLFCWRIAGDFTKRITSGGEKLCSPDFQFFGHLWYIRMNTKSTSHPGNVAVWLCRRNLTPLPLSPPIRVTFGVRKSDGVEERYEGDGLMKDSVPLLSHTDLESRKSELLSSGTLTLTVTCRMEVLDTEVPRKEDAAVQCEEDNFAGVPLGRLSSDFEQLLVSKEKCDVTLRVADREFPAHRLVLAVRSSVFKAMFQKDTAEEQTGIVEIEDCDAESFGTFLHFLYCGKFDGVTSDNALHLYISADKYDVRELKEFCMKHMEQNVTVENVCHVVRLADQYDETELMSAAQSFFNQNSEDILQTSEWLKFMAKHHRLANRLFLEFSKNLVPKKKKEDCRN